MMEVLCKILYISDEPQRFASLQLPNVSVKVGEIRD